MNFSRGFLCILLTLVPVLVSEAFSYYWMNPKNASAALVHPVFDPPVADETFELQQEQFDRVKKPLLCSGGWIGKLGGKETALTRLVWVEWNNTSTGNTLEAFRHMPEQCMGSVGMKLERNYPARIFGTGERQLVFDSTVFRPLRGGPAMHVFKAVWVSGQVGANLRESVLGGASQRDLKALRLATAIHRFKPEQTRVMMAGVVGLPSEELAWASFSREVLPRIEWISNRPNLYQ